MSEEFREGIDPRRAPQVVVGEYPVGEAYLEPINTVMRATNKGQAPLKFVAVQVSPPEMPDAVAASENWEPAGTSPPSASQPWLG